jgi:hypothetical protein
MYADFVAYNADKAVVWGGHSGNLNKFEEFYPVLRKPLDYFVDKYAVDYVVIDRVYVQPERLGIDGSMRSLDRFGPFLVYEVSRPALLLRSDAVTR